MQIRLAGLDEHVRSRRFFVFRPSRASSDRRWPPSSFPAPPSLIIPLFPYFFVRGSISERDAWSFVQRNRIVVAVHSRSTRSWKRVEMKKEEREKMKICREKLFDDWTLLIYTRGGIFWARVDYWMDIEHGLLFQLILIETQRNKASIDRSVWNRLLETVNHSPLPVYFSSAKRKKKEEYFFSNSERQFANSTRIKRSLGPTCPSSRKRSGILED